MRFIKVLPLVLGLCVASFVYANSIHFNLSDLDGKDHKLSDYQGKWVVVNYWASWCPPCVAEIPELIEFQSDFANKDVQVLGVNFEDASESKIKTFLEDYQINYPILLAEPDSHSDLGRITGLPTTFIVSPNGEVVHKKEGIIDKGYLEKIISEYKRKLGMVSPTNN